VSNFIENIMLGLLSTNCVRQKKRGGVSCVCGIVYWIQYTVPWLIIINAIKTVANLYGYVTLYESYKHDSKYIFDNNLIYVLLRRVTFLRYIIFIQGLVFIENCNFANAGFHSCSLVGL